MKKRDMGTPKRVAGPLTVVPMLMSAIHDQTGEAEIDGEWTADDELVRGTVLTPHSVGVVGWALLTVLSHQSLLADPRALVGRRTLRQLQQRRRAYLADVARMIGANGEAGWTQQVGCEIRSPHLAANVAAHWHPAERSGRPALADYQLLFFAGEPCRPQRSRSHHPDAPVRSGDVGSRRLDVLVAWGAAKRRVRPYLPPARWRGGPARRRSFPRGAQNIYDLLEPYAVKSLYLPAYDRPPTALQIRRSVKDLLALLLLYLAQSRARPPLIDLTTDQSAADFLRQYLTRFRYVTAASRRADALDPLTVLGELLRPYRVPEDYRGLRMYVARTIRGLRRQNTGAWRTSRGEQPLRRRHGRWVQSPPPAAVRPCRCRRGGGATRGFSACAVLSH